MGIEFPDDSLDEGSFRGDMPAPDSWHGCVVGYPFSIAMYSTYSLDKAVCLRRAATNELIDFFLFSTDAVCSNITYVKGS